MIHSVITNDILKGILFIEHAKDEFGGIRIPVGLSGKLRKSSRKKSSLASAKIEGNPLTEEQASAAIGSLEEYFAYDIDEYYRSLQMGLPPLCYEGRLDPPQPEIWLSYFVRMMELRARGVKTLISSTDAERTTTAQTHLSIKESRFLDYLRQNDIRRFSPSELASAFGVTNRTVINWCAALVRAGLLSPDLSGSRILSYSLVTDAVDGNR